MQMNLKVINMAQNTEEIKVQEQTSIQPPQKKSGGVGRIIAAVLVVVIIIIAVVLIAIFQWSNDDNNGDDNGGKNGGNGIDYTKFFTAKKGKDKADEAALKWDSSAVLQYVRGFEGNFYYIDMDDWQWVNDNNIKTNEDKSIGDGNCIAWEYEYYPADGDLFDRLHVIVIENKDIIQWEDQLSESASSGDLTNWHFDSDGASNVAKTLELYNNITGDTPEETYVYYELRPDYWEINCYDKSDSIRIVINEPDENIDYHYP
jgi:hypothetical protein